MEGTAQSPEVRKELCDREEPTEIIEQKGEKRLAYVGRGQDIQGLVGSKDVAFSPKCRTI